MTLSLDLRSCDAKLARARENARTLERETVAHIGKQEATHAVRFSQVDPQTGWCSITLVPQKIEEPRLSAILGDVIHNLRCALDYVVTALVDASQTKLTTSHQFPIFKDAAFYASRVRDQDGSPPRRPPALHRSRPQRHRGMAAIQRPEQSASGPRVGNPSFLERRQASAARDFGLVPVGQFHIDYRGHVVEEDWLDEVRDWQPGQDIPVGRIRLTLPSR